MIYEITSKHYTSKDEIYKDYQIAIRLVLEHSFHPGIYDKLNLVPSDQLRIENYTKLVKNFGKEYPLSVGFCVEVPLIGDTGEVYDTQFVLLGHENGPEIFLSLIRTGAVAVGTWAVLRVSGKLFDKIIGPSLDRIINVCKEHLYGGVRIDRVEIRTANKGVLTLPFSKFTFQQLRCVIERFDSIYSLSEAIEGCFKDAMKTVAFRPALNSKLE